MIARYLLNVLMAVDEGVNALLGGDPHECLSSRIGKAAAGDYGEFWQRTTAPVQRSIDWVALHAFGQADHCATSRCPDLGTEDLIEHRGQNEAHE